MCYYARTDYACLDWKWGNMRLQCPRERRIGETCGAKLVHHESVSRSDKPCKTCEEIEVKRRRIARLRDNIQRWMTEGDRFRASLEKADREVQELQDKIEELNRKRPAVVARLNGQARGLGTAPAASYTGNLPGVSPASSGYTYASSASSPSSSYSGYNTTAAAPAQSSANSVAKASGGRQAVAYSQYQYKR